MASLIGPGPGQVPTNAMLFALLGGQRGPLKTTAITSGSGTFTPAVDGGLCKITLIPAGGGGARPSDGSNTGGGAGSAGSPIEIWMRLTGGQYYSVGAAGTGATSSAANGVAASNTVFGTLAAPGGLGGISGGSPQAAPTSDSIFLRGGVGGAGGNNSTGSKGGAPGGLAAASGRSAGGTAAGGYGGGGGGGDSPYGVGGDGGAATLPGSNGSGFGAGGGGGGGGATSGNGGDGAPAKIIVEEYGNV